MSSATEAAASSASWRGAQPLSEHPSLAPPFITIAIPQYKRRRYLELNLESVFAQTFSDFEVLVSDDKSPDDSNAVIPRILEQSGRFYRYFAQTENLGYDQNVRFCLSAARGRYVMLLGNDDALAHPTTLDEIAAALTKLDYPEVAVTNYEDWESGKATKRAYATRILGASPSAAVHYFRSFSFVSGLIYASAEARQHETDKWDKSIYYQMYLACRIIAAGGRLAGLEISAVRDQIRLEGEIVPEAYQREYENAGWTLKSKHTGLDSVARVVVDAVLPYVPAPDRSSAITSIWKQLLVITYPYWIFEYRRLANWSWGLAVAKDLWPGNRLREYELTVPHRVFLWCLYFGVTFSALVIPSSLFNAIRHRLAELVRKLRQRGQADLR